MYLKNPYSELINMMREQGAKYNPPSLQLGIVMTSQPLKIKSGDMQLNLNNLLLADNIKNKLITGDTVALIQTDDSTFIVLCKVVRP